MDCHSNRSGLNCPSYLIEPKQMTTQSKTFCPAPWTTLNIDQTGRVMPCMHSPYQLGNIKEKSIQEILTDFPLRDLKSTMAQEQWHSACAWCKQLEETTGASGRTVRHASAEVKEKIDADIDWFGLEHIVINWSNLCNLTCTYCNPQTSTAWQSVKKIPIVHVKNEHPDLIELARTHGSTIQGLTLGGGEPLLQKGLDQFLQYLDPAAVAVLVTTNLSVDLEKNIIYQQLKKFKNIQWMISFDNADRKKFEYVRNGACWQEFERNISIMKRDDQKIVAHPAYSIYNALDLVQYYEYCEQHDLDLYWCELTHPFDLDVRRYPLHIRNKAVAEIDRVCARWGTEIRAIKTLLAYRKQLLDNSYLISPSHVVEPRDFHRQLETQLNQADRFEDLWPGLALPHVEYLPEPWHPGITERNTDREWMPSDTEESFREMMRDPKHRQYFSEQGWDRPGAISYRLNSHGFRSEEFVADRHLIALGCSYTMGIGLPVESVWPSLVGKALDMPVANLAWGGSSVDTCYRLLRYWIRQLNPPAVMILVPPIDRLELILDETCPITGQGKAEVFMPTSLSDHYNPKDRYFYHWFLQDENKKLNREKNLLAMQALCDQYQVPFFVQDTNTTMTRSREDIGYARDHLHGGPKIHQEIASIFVREYQDRSGI